MPEEKLSKYDAPTIKTPIKRQEVEPGKEIVERKIYSPMGGDKTAAVRIQGEGWKISDEGDEKQNRGI